MTKVLLHILGAIASLNPVLRSLLIVGTIGVAIVPEVRTLWGEVFGRIDSIVILAMPNADFSPLSFANYCLPVAEICTMLTSLIALRGLLVVVRIIKSFIPTIA